MFCCHVHDITKSEIVQFSAKSVVLFRVGNSAHVHVFARARHLIENRSKGHARMLLAEGMTMSLQCCSPVHRPCLKPLFGSQLVNVRLWGNMLFGSEMNNALLLFIVPSALKVFMEAPSLHTNILGNPLRFRQLVHQQRSRLYGKATATYCWPHTHFSSLTIIG